MVHTYMAYYTCLMLGRMEDNLVSAEVSVNRVGFQSCVL